MSAFVCDGVSSGPLPSLLCFGVVEMLLVPRMAIPPARGGHEGDALGLWALVPPMNSSSALRPGGTLPTPPAGSCGPISGHVSRLQPRREEV